MDASPQQTSAADAPTTFNAEWTPSKAAVFDANNAPVAKVPRAWDRKPTTSIGDNGKVKTVWKRYQLRSQPGSSSQQAESVDADLDDGALPGTSPGRVVKKARVGSPVKVDDSTSQRYTRRKSSATKYERRKSGYRRKMATQVVSDPLPDSAIEYPTLDLEKDDEKEAEDNADDTPASTDVHDAQDEAEDMADAQPPANHESEKLEEDVSDSVLEDNMMCEAAEAQLLNEAGIEPINADFFISPVKKRVATHVERAEVMGTRTTTLPDTQPLELVANENQHSIPGSDADSDTLEPKAQIEPTQVASETEIEITEAAIATEAVNIQDGLAQLEESKQPDRPSSKAVEYPSIDIFGLGEPVLAPVHNEAAIASEQDEDHSDDEDTQSDNDGQDGPRFSISLNDETVNLGALLARNNNLAAVVTDDEIQLEIEEAGHGEAVLQNDIPLVEEAGVQEVVEEGAAADSPDELSMDFEPTETITASTTEAFTHLEDDKAKLSLFLKRVAAAKMNKGASTSRRESLKNRRDSDQVRKALASPRQVLEEKDSNQSPQRLTQPQPLDTTLNLDQMLSSPLVKPASRPSRPQVGEEDVDELAGEPQTGSPRRRSSRTRSKLVHQPSTATPSGPNKISVRTDGGEKVNLNRSETTQLAELVRKNTKKNKGGSIPAPQRLAKLKLDALLDIVDAASPVVQRLLKEGVRHVTWREELVEYSTSIATADLEAAALLAETEETAVNKEPKKKTKLPSTGTSKMRRLRRPGATNGTPAKEVLRSIPLPDDGDDQQTTSMTSSIAAIKRKQRSIGVLAMSTELILPPVTTIVPDMEEEVVAKSASLSQAQPKSKLLPPKKLRLNPSIASLGGLGKENTSGLPAPTFAGLNSPAKKPVSKIPAPSGTPIPGAALSFEPASGIRSPAKRVRSGLSKKL